MVGQAYDRRSCFESMTIFLVPWCEETQRFLEGTLNATGRNEMKDVAKHDDSLGLDGLGVLKKALPCELKVMTNGVHCRDAVCVPAVRLCI